MSFSGLKLGAPAKEFPHRTKYRRHLVRARASINCLGQLLIDPPPADNRPYPSVLPTTGTISKDLHSPECFTLEVIANY